MSSQFEELFKARNEDKSPAKKKAAKSKREVAAPPPQPETEVALPLAKSKNSDFEQTLIYLKKNTKKEVKKVLLDDALSRDFSDLVGELLSQWLENQK